MDYTKYAFKSFLRGFLFFLPFWTFSQSVTELEARLKTAKSRDEFTKISTDLATAYYRNGDFTNALSYYLRALDTTDRSKNFKHAAVAHHGIGSVYFETGKFDEAIPHLKKAEKIFTDTKDEVNLCRSLITLGNVYYMQLSDSLSEIYFLKALNMAEGIHDSETVFNSYTNLGALYFEMGSRIDTLKAVESIKKSLNYVRPTDTARLFQVNLGLAELYTYSKNSAEGKVYLDKCEALLQNVKQLNAIDDYYYCLHHYYKEKGDFEKALEAFGNYKIYQDSVLNIEKNKQLTEMNVKYESGQKEKQIALLNAQKETQRLIIIIIVLVISLLIAVSWFMFSRYRKQQERKKEQELQAHKEMERIRIARDMHDEIGAGLTRIVMRSEQTRTQMQSEGVKNGVADSLVKMTTEARELSRNIGEIIWALNPKNDSLDSLFAYIRNYAYDYLENANISCIANFPEDIPKFPISPEVRRNIFLIVKESLNNIVKHSGASEVQLQLVLSEKDLSLTIKDNGKGLPNQQQVRGNGLENMKKRAEESGGSLVIESNPEYGTLITAAKIPIHKNPTKVGLS